MDYALITTAVTAVKGAHDVLRAALNLKVETEVSLKMSDALQKLDSVQEAVFQAREDLFRLQRERRSAPADPRARRVGLGQEQI